MLQLFQGQLLGSGLAPVSHNCTNSSSSPAADALCCCLPAVNFALQLEYLEAAFYSCATTGAPLPASVTGSTTVITEGCARGNYTEEAHNVFGEIAADELNHVKVSKELVMCTHLWSWCQLSIITCALALRCCMPQPWLTPSACMLPLIAHRRLWCLHTFTSEQDCLLTTTPPCPCAALC